MLSGLVFSLIVFAPMVMGAALAVVARRMAGNGGAVFEPRDPPLGRAGNSINGNVAEHDANAGAQRHVRPIPLAIVLGLLALGAAASGPIELLAGSAFVWVETGLLLAIMMGALVAFAALLGSRSLRLHHREGTLADDIALGSGLAAFTGEGGVILHNLPADGFHIDHVVVGVGAIFAIQTEWRRRPDPDSGVSAKVSFDGCRLQFPDSQETAPLDRARRSGRWLADYLTCALGEPIAVVPVLALPDWDVVTDAESNRSDVIVSNGVSPTFVTSLSFGSEIPPQVRTLATAALCKRFIAMRLVRAAIDIRA